MQNKLLISAAAVALIAAGGFANAQGMQEKPQAPKAQVQQPVKGGAEMRGTTGQASPAEKGGKAEMKGEMKAGDSKADVKTRAETKPEMKGADSKSDMKSRADSKSTNDTKTSVDTKTNADSKSKMDNKADAKSDAKSTTTTGQGAAGSQGAANLSTEQRTKIRTVIKERNVRPVTNVNFSISIGSRVPRTVTFYPLPVQVVEYYPAWRGYQFILVGDEILVINPRTLEIVAVLEA